METHPISELRTEEWESQISNSKPRKKRQNRKRDHSGRRLRTVYVPISNKGTHITEQEKEHMEQPILRISWYTLPSLVAVEEVSDNSATTNKSTDNGSAEPITQLATTDLAIINPDYARRPQLLCTIHHLLHINHPST